VAGSYTIAALCAPVLVGVLEVKVLRTGLLRRPRFWLTLAITLGFQIPVDGWLTKLSAPIVSYRTGVSSGVRWPWDIPVEDFGFAIAMITFTVLVWELSVRKAREPAVPSRMAVRVAGFMNYIPPRSKKSFTHSNIPFLRLVNGYRCRACPGLAPGDGGSLA